MPGYPNEIDKVHLVLALVIWPRESGQDHDLGIANS